MWMGLDQGKPSGKGNMLRVPFWDLPNLSYKISVGEKKESTAGTLGIMCHHPHSYEQTH